MTRLAESLTLAQKISLWRREFMLMSFHDHDKIDECINIVQTRVLNFMKECDIFAPYKAGKNGKS